MKVHVIIQARMGSNRLPGKVLKTVLDKPLLEFQIERLKRAKLVDKTIVATTTNRIDDLLVDFCQKKHIAVVRGSEDDVLDRFYQVYLQDPSDHIVRITADCPLIDPEILDAVINCHVNSDCDYTSNIMEPSFPDGLDVEVFKTSVLIRAWHDAKLASDREHVTKYVYTHPELFSTANFKHETDLSALRWTVDNEEDFTVIKYILETLYPKNQEFTYRDVLALYSDDKNASALGVNKHFQRNEGLATSLLNDAKQEISNESV